MTINRVARQNAEHANKQMASRIARIVSRVYVRHADDSAFSDEELWLWVETEFAMPRDSLIMDKIFKLVAGTASALHSELMRADNVRLRELEDEVMGLKYKLAMSIGGDFDGGGPSAS